MNFSVEVVSSTVHTVVWVMIFFIAKTSSHSMPNIGPYDTKVKAYLNANKELINFGAIDYF